MRIARAVALGAAISHAHGAASIEQVTFPVADAVEPGSVVAGELRVPASPRERLPAVLIVNSSPGFDGRGAFYAQALNAAGIATLEVDWFHGRGLPVTPRHNLAHAWASLRWLAAHPRIDERRDCQRRRESRYCAAVPRIRGGLVRPPARGPLTESP
jgi:hypothetical protein